MTPVAYIQIEADIVAALEARGIITPAGAYDGSKLNDVAEVLGVVSDVEAVLGRHGVTLPPKVDALLKALPLIAPLIGLFVK